MNKRKNHVARVDRKVLPKSEIYVTDLWGNRQARQIWCKHHKRWEDCRLFYFESSAKAKHEYELRDMCIEAWELTEGKVNFDADKSTATLISFFKD